MNKHRRDGEAKRELIYETALALFRDKGFDATTMRDIAREAGISIGNAYHYFPSKNAIVTAYYTATQGAHEKLTQKRLLGVHDVRERLGIVFHTKLDGLRKDRELLVGVARSVVVPGDPLSAFSRETEEVRERAVAQFRAAIEPSSLTDQDKDVVARLLWGTQLASLLYLVHDESRGQKKTKILIDGVLDLVAPLLALAALPLAAPMLERARQVFQGAFD